MNLDMKNKKYDLEWVKLIIKAKASGLTVEEIRLFLAHHKKRSHT